MTDYTDPIVRDAEEREAAEDAYYDTTDPAYEAWVEKEMERGDLAFQPDTLPCYECLGFDGTPVEREVVKLGPVTGAADPTQTYVLACGHTVI